MEMEMKMTTEKDKKRRINIKLPAVWEPKCCATCDRGRTISHCLRNYRRIVVPDYVYPIVGTCWERERTQREIMECDPDCCAKTITSSGRKRRSCRSCRSYRSCRQMVNHLTGHNGREYQNPLLLFKLYGKIAKPKHRLIVGKYNCNSFLPNHTRGVIRGHGKLKWNVAMWQTDVYCIYCLATLSL